MSNQTADQNLGQEKISDAKKIFVLKANGERELFDSAKLEHSLKHAGASSRAVEKILSAINSEISDGMATHDIYRRAFSMLHSDEKPIAIRYSMRRAVMELGPSGFPFEDYVAEILKHKGFETKTDQIVHGQYVEHEIDVVAWNEEKLIMCEAKFHNEPGVKTDLKVALYVKERFDDLSTQTFEYGGKKRNLDEGWLITNTKFTSTAIEYGRHQGSRLVMIGWNYPEHGNLHDMIIEAKLHPLTTLTTLPSHARKVLLEKGIVLCKTLLEKPDLLTIAGVTGPEADDVLEEVRSL